MEPRVYTLQAPDQIHPFFRGYRSHPPTGWWFRGHADSSWDLMPKAGRTAYRLNDGKSLGRFRRWSKQAVAYTSTLPENDWERLAIAQHHGLATCLLDWTYNPLVALYFACRECPSSSGVVFCYDPALFIDENKSDLWNIECNGFGFIPRSISPRILNQRGIFTVHLPAHTGIAVAPSSVARDHPNLVKLIVPSEMKEAILTLLDDYGINHATLFPDLEGLSQHINWETVGVAKEAAKRKAEQVARTNAMAASFLFSEADSSRGSSLTLGTRLWTNRS